MLNYYKLKGWKKIEMSMSRYPIMNIVLENLENNYDILYVVKNENVRLVMAVQK